MSTLTAWRLSRQDGDDVMFDGFDFEETSSADQAVSQQQFPRSALHNSTSQARAHTHTPASSFTPPRAS